MPFSKVKYTESGIAQAEMCVFCGGFFLTSQAKTKSQEKSQKRKRKSRSQKCQVLHMLKWCGSAMAKAIWHWNHTAITCVPSRGDLVSLQLQYNGTMDKPLLRCAFVIEPQRLHHSHYDPTWGQTVLFWHSNHRN